MEDLLAGGVAIGVDIVEVAGDFFGTGTADDEVVGTAFAVAVAVLGGDFATFYAVVGAVEAFVLTNRRFFQFVFFVQGVGADFARAYVLGEVDDVVQFGVVLRVVVKDATDVKRTPAGRQVVVRGRRGVVHLADVHVRVAVVSAVGVSACIEAAEGTQRQVLAGAFFVFVILAAVFGLRSAGVEAARQGHAVDAQFVGAAVFAGERLAIDGQVVVTVAVQRV